jgi:hypothetical protein
MSGVLTCSPVSSCSGLEGYARRERDSECRDGIAIANLDNGAQGGTRTPTTEVTGT